jgi:hypothetical protein
MYSTIYKPCLLFLCCSVVITQSFAQENCAQILTQMIKKYENGAIDDEQFVKRLADCVETGNLDKTQKIQAYKYLTLIYLYQNENRLAIVTMENFLQLILPIEPDYNPYDKKLDESKIPEFLELYNRMRAAPTHYLSFRIGVNASTVQVIRAFSLDSDESKKPSYQLGIGFQAGVGVEIPLTSDKQRTFITPELLFAARNYEFKDKVLGFADVSMSESQYWLELPVTLRWYMNENKTRPFLFGGGALQFLMSANATIIRKDVFGNGQIREISSPEPISLRTPKLRKTLNGALVAGGGFKFRNFLKTGGDLTVEARYTLSLANVVKTQNRIANEELIYDYGYIDSDFRIQSFGFSLSYLLPKYRPEAIYDSGKSTINFDSEK